MINTNALVHYIERMKKGDPLIQSTSLSSDSLQLRRGMERGQRPDLLHRRRGRRIFDRPAFLDKVREHLEENQSKSQV